MGNSREKSQALALQRIQYADKWSIDAAKYESGEDYAWMANMISDYKTVIEFGTGDGSSTLSLVERGHVVIGIDENIECLKKAYDKLKLAGHFVKLLHREDFKA